MPNKIKKEYSIKLLNKMFELNPKIPMDIKSQYKIDTKSSLTAQEEAYNVQITLNKNFIMSNIENVIRSQIYSNLRDAVLTETTFGFWEEQNPQGKEIIYENKLTNTPRTGNITADLASISPEPEAEIQVLELTENTANDIKVTMSIQEWATLQGFTSWLSERFDNQLKSIDEDLYKYLLGQINDYVYTDIVVIALDGLSDEEIAGAFEKQIMLSVIELTSGYSSDKNSLTYSNLEIPTNIGMLISYNSSVLREIDYLRKQYKNSVNAPKDFNVGHIAAVNFEETDRIDLLPKHKFHWGKQRYSGTTPFGYAYIDNLKTEGVFFGSLFMESAPATQIIGETAAPPETPENLEKVLLTEKQKKEALIKKVVDKKIAKAKENLEKISIYKKSENYSKLDLKVKNNVNNYLNQFEKYLNNFVKDINLWSKKIKVVIPKIKKEKTLEIKGLNEVLENLKENKDKISVENLKAIVEALKEEKKANKEETKAN